MTLQDIARQILGQGKQAIFNIPSWQQQKDQLMSMPQEEIQKRAMELMMAGTIGSPQAVTKGATGIARQLIGNQPKIAGTLRDIANIKNLQSEDFIDTIENTRSLGIELLPRQTKSKSIQALEKKDIEEWMRQMAKLIIEKTNIYPSMGS